MTRTDLALAALATAAVPGMRPVQVAGIRTGEENPLHQSALVEDVTGRKWLVRAPLGAAAGAELERNDDLVRQLGKHLPFKVPAAAGYADLGPDGRAAVYPYVEGQGLSLRHLPVGPGLTNAVGRALAAIHNMPRELFEEHAVPVFDAAEFRARKLTELDRAAETGHVPNGLLARWEQALDAEQMWEFATVPTHGSLDGASFLVVFSEDDAASGRVVGISGWERAQVADPAEDFARLVQQSHPHAVDEVFESYSMARGQRPDGYLLHRARLASEMRLLGGLVAAIGTEDQDFVRTRADQLRKLDRLTANDNSLVPRTAAPTSEPPAESPDPETSTLPDAAPAGIGEEQPDAVEPAPDEPGEAGVDDAPEVPEDERAVVVEQPAEGVHLEPVHPVEDEKAVSAADVTAPIPMFHPVPSATADTEEDDATDEIGPGADAPEGDDATDETGPAVDAPEADDATDETVSATDPPEADDATDEIDSPDGDAEHAEEDIAEQERLHTLYGMPDDDEVDSDPSGGR